MARKLDRILVIDVEATCWEGEPPPGQTSEIVEIGLCVLDVATLARVERLGIPYPFGPTHLNVKSLLAVARAWPREVGMSEALKREGLPLEGTHHRGVDEAWNIAAILGRLLRASRGPQAGSASGAPPA
jgi:inhibitor of KinA sporulation pathway (predicted exonuclease)